MGGILTDTHKRELSDLCGKDLFSGRFITCSRNPASWVKRKGVHKLFPTRLPDKK